MATGTKQQWLNLSRQLHENTTPRELGEAVLALAQRKRAVSHKTDYRIWIAVVIGVVILTSIGVSREVVNARALSAQVEEITEAHTEASEQARIAEESKAETERVTAEKMELVRTVQVITSETIERARAELLGLREEDADQIAGEPFAFMRFAGELMRQSGIPDEEFQGRYDDATNEILTRLAQYLKPGIDVSGVVIIEAKDGQP